MFDERCTETGCLTDQRAQDDKENPEEFLDDRLSGPKNFNSSNDIQNENDLGSTEKSIVFESDIPRFSSLTKPRIPAVGPT